MTNDSRIMDIVYKRRNGESIIGDPQAIESCKNEQSRDVIDNARLGSYDKFGNYVIIPDIKRELVSMPKLVYNIKSEGNKTVYELKSNIPMFGDLYFKLVFAGEEAVLKITETVNREANGYLEVYDEVVDSMSYGKNALPQDIIFRNYNVVDKPDDFGKTSGLYDFNNILTRKVYLSLLSKELKDVSKFDEHDAFNKMVKTLKESGEYGTRVLKEFVNRLKERPGIFEITQTENYNKAVNEVLLSSLDLATTQEDKEEYTTRQTYFQVLNARNENIKEFLDEANARVDEKYVKNIVDKATQNFQQENEQEDESIEEFFDRIANKKSVPTKRKLEKAILKQGKGQEDEEGKSKEDKIKSILDKKDKEKEGKKTPAGKKLKPSKSKSSSKKLKGAKKKSASKKKAGAKKKGAKKKLGKGKIKGKKKKIKKAKSPQKAKAKAGGKLGGKPGGAKKAAKKAKKKSSIMTAYQKDDRFEGLINFTSSSSTIMHKLVSNAAKASKEQTRGPEKEVNFVYKTASFTASKTENQKTDKFFVIKEKAQNAKNNEYKDIYKEYTKKTNPDVKEYVKGKEPIPNIKDSVEFKTPEPNKFNFNNIKQTPTQGQNPVIDSPVVDINLQPIDPLPNINPVVTESQPIDQNTQTQAGNEPITNINTPIPGVFGFTPTQPQNSTNPVDQNPTEGTPPVQGDDPH